MKIGVRPHDLEFETTEELIEICKSMTIDGLQLVNLRTYPNIMDNPKLIDTEIQKLINSGVDIFLLGSYFNMIHPNDETLKNGYDIFKLNTEIARRNKILNIGSETGSINGDAWTYHPDNHTEESFKKLERSIVEITSYLDDEYYLLEPVYDHVSYDLDTTIRMASDKKVGITLDLSNLLNVDNHQDYLGIFESFLDQFASKIRIFHFKNFNIVEGQKVLCQLDKGYMDYEKIVSLVNKYNLSHIPVIVEEIQGEALKNSIDYLRKMEA